MNTKLIVYYIVGEILSLLGMGVALFWSAGRIDWWPAWAAIGVMSVWMIGMAIINSRNPDLMAERLKPPKDAKQWDTIIVVTIRLTTLARYILAGLDQRYSWTGGFPIAVQIAALIVCALGYDVLFMWASASNAFFSQVVRIQSERGHTVATGGPYQYVRHPAYIGGILYELGVSVLLASWWALIASGLSATLLVLRAGLEDRTLQVELPGYADYVQKVRYRLIPGIW
jgi:protein-S-isoprenylcysteine O-methyltransferase Ste14